MVFQRRHNTTFYKRSHSTKAAFNISRMIHGQTCNLPLILRTHSSHNLFRPDTDELHGSVLFSPLLFSPLLSSHLLSSATPLFTTPLLSSILSSFILSSFLCSPHVQSVKKSTDFITHRGILLHETGEAGLPQYSPSAGVPAIPKPPLDQSPCLAQVVCYCRKMMPTQ